MKNMDASELVKQPQDVTENPYRSSAKDKTDKQRTGFTTEEVNMVSYNCKHQTFGYVDILKVYNLTFLSH